MDASHALSQSRAQSVQGARAATVGIQGFNNERAADFWLHKYGTPCPFFNALENVHVAPGSAGSGAGGSGAFALPPAGRSTTVGFGRGGVSSNQLRRASQTGAIAASSRALNAKSMKRKVGEEVKAGAKLTLYDPECRNQPIKVEKVTYKRREGKGVVGRLRGEVGRGGEERKEERGGEQEEGEEEEYGEDEDFELDIPGREGGEAKEGDTVEVKAPPVRPPMPFALTPDVLKKGKNGLKDGGGASTSPIDGKPLSPMRPAGPFGGALTPADLMKGKAGLGKKNIGLTIDSAGGGGDDKYLPKSPLNLKSKLLKNALDKGKAKLKKQDWKKEEEGGREGGEGDLRKRR